MGVLREPNLDFGYADVIPSIVQEGEGDRVYIEEKVPTRVPLSRLQNAVIRPQKEGWLKARESAINRRAIKSPGDVGFGAPKR